jgi:hypothetical protein
LFEQLGAPRAGCIRIGPLLFAVGEYNRRMREKTRALEEKFLFYVASVERTIIIPPQRSL